MFTVNQVSLHFGDRTLFDEVSFFIGKEDRVGLAGRNGQGKTTMLKLLAGEMRYDSGSIEHPKGLRIGYLPQTMEHDLTLTARQVAGKAFVEAEQAQSRLAVVEKAIENPKSDEEAMELAIEIGELHEKLNSLGAGDNDKKVERDLEGIGFSKEDMDKPMGQLSGGWRMRAELTRILLMRPDLLMLDEPTNHLDLPAIQWLEDLMSNWPGAFILISHDKLFLDRLTKRTIEVNNGKIIDRKVPWSQYVELRKVEREQQIAASKAQTKEIEHTQELINKFRAKKNKAAFAQSLIKKLDKMDRVEVDDAASRAMLVRFPPAPRSGKIVLELERVSKSFGDNLIVKGADLVVARGEHLAIVGANGTGKTTMMRMILGEESHEGSIKLGHNVIVGYYAQDMPERLDPKLTVLETAEAAASEDTRTKVRAMLGAFLFSGEDVDKYVSVLSGGERARVALCCMLLQPLNFLILDEPTHHLDIPSKDVLKQALKHYDGTFILISHDRDFLSGLTDRLLELEGGRLRDQHHDIEELLARKKEEGEIAFAQKKVKVASSQKEDYEARKAQDKQKRKLNSKIKRCEDELAKLEAEQEKLNAELAQRAADAEFQRKGYEDLVLISNRIDKLMSDWEEAESRLQKMN
jgi:ATP-binding cassette subfamily F protein 3